MQEEQVLIIGPSSTFGKGGIGSVLAVYKQILPNAYFYASYRSYSNKFLSFSYGILRLFLFPFYLLMNNQINIVHIHGASRGSFYRKYIYIVVSKFIFKKLVVYHVHGAEFHLFIEESSPAVQDRIRRVFNTVNLVVVLSDSWKSYFQSKFPQASIKVLANPVQGEKFSLVREKVGNDEMVRFLFLGRLSNRKGVDLLLGACDELNQQGLQFKVSLTGDGSISEYQELIAARDLADKVEMNGWIDGDLKLEFLKSHDVLVLPSRNEGLPVSIIEAMASSMPVIASKVGGIPELVEHGVTGFLFSLDNPQELSSLMSVFVENKSLIHEMGRAARERFLLNYDASVIRTKLDDLYKGVKDEL
jgi:glycosyltransferase involved in cell wall biosynthesis